MENKQNNKDMNTVEYTTPSGTNMTAIITGLEPNDRVNGFKLSFRLYDNTNECGGFETTLWVSGADISTAKMFCGLDFEYKAVASMLDAKITGKKTINKVSKKHQYESIFN